MENRSLRIGNYVINNSRNSFKIEDGEDIDNSEYFNPIDLTEDILFNCGFSKNVGYYIMFGRYKDKTLELAYNNDTSETQYYVYVRGLLDNEFVQLRHDLKYLHELQNLYFAIIGNELSVKKI